MIYKNIILIPARLNSKRLDKKLLLEIDGKSIIQHSYENSLKSKLSQRSIILVDSEELLVHCQTFTDDVFLTSDSHSSGTERIIEYINLNDEFDNIVNIQADEPFVNPDLVDSIFNELINGSNIVSAVYTLDDDDSFDPNRVKVVLNKDFEAVYFSRSEIPFNRDSDVKVRKHIHLGIYGYKLQSLRNYSNYSNRSLEKIEKLEQLRFIENGDKIKIVISHESSIGIDTLQDFEKAIIYYEKR